MSNSKILSIIFIFSVIIISITNADSDIDNCDPNRTFTDLSNKTRFCGYFNKKTLEANLLEREMYIETMKLILADKGSEIIYGLDGQNRLAYRFVGGVLNQVEDQFNKDILNGKLIEVAHTHPWFGLNVPNPSPADSEAFSFWASYNKQAIYKIIYSPSIDMNASKEEIESFLQNSKDLKILTSVFVPQFAD